MGRMASPRPNPTSLLAALTPPTVINPRSESMRVTSKSAPKSKSSFTSVPTSPQSLVQKSTESRGWTNGIIAARVPTEVAVQAPREHHVEREVGGGSHQSLPDPAPDDESGVAGAAGIREPD